MEEEIKIPKERIAVLIGEKGATKRDLQRSTHTKIKISSSEGDIKIEGKDPYLVYVTAQIIKAIARGFNPDIAKMLLKDDCQMEILNIKDYARHTKNDIRRIKSRAIGTKGKARRTIERLTNTHISIYGKTIAIIGLIEDVQLARRALDKLLRGSPHGPVYKWIERQRALEIM
jgi:ribosomal RNA assembly protein